MNSKSVGERTEAVVLARYVLAGKTVLMPFGDNQRYDLVVEENGSFIRVQCKTGRLRNGAILFATSSSQYHRGRGAQNYRGQADLFAVYCPQTDEVYVIPVDQVGTHGASLRIVQPKNGQGKKVLWAADFKM